LRTYYRIQKKQGFFVFFCLLLSAYTFLLFACGKKGEPTLKSYDKPPAPSDLTAVHRETDIFLLWNFPKDKELSLKGFHLIKSTGRDFHELAFLKNDQRSFTDKGFQPEKSYKYKIVSESLKDVASKDSNILEVKPKNPPAPPESASFSIEHDSVTLSWASAGEGVLYNVYRSDTRGVYSLMPANKGPLRDTQYKDTFIIKKPVYYTIRSSAGTEIRDEGPASKEIAIDASGFVPPAPEGIQAVVTKETIYLLWKEPVETWTTGYRVYREISKEEGYVFIGESQTPSFLDKDTSLQKRNYRITVMGPVKEGPPAEIRDVVYKKPK
jgi:fibronectin type 3 domain-containing protein